MFQGWGYPLHRFAYDLEWLQASHELPIDPELKLFSGEQFSDKHNFRIFLDSCPDRWGRLLMPRREAAIAGLRFKNTPDGNFQKQRLTSCNHCTTRELHLGLVQLTPAQRRSQHHDQY